MVNGEPFHEPAELLFRECPDVFRGSRPLETPAFQPLIQKYESVSLPVERFNPISSPAAEQKQTVGEGVKLKALLNHSGQPVNTPAQVCVAAGQIHVRSACDI